MVGKGTQRFRLLTLLLLAMLVLAACGGDDDNEDEDNDSSEATDVAPATINLQMSWTHSNEYAGFYMAEVDGLYADENITLTMTPLIDAAGNFLDVVDEVVNGNAQFGVADAGQLMLAREQGHPLVAVAVIYQRHPLALTSLAESGITAPEDLIGKDVHVTPQSRTILDALLAARDIDPATVNIVERTDLTTGVLTSGDADVIDAWITNEVVALINEGIAYNTIFAYDYGVDMYPNVIFTTEEYIANNRDVVLRFVRATLKGIEDAVGDPATAAAEAVKRDPALNAAVEQQAIRLAVPLLIPQGSRAGMMLAENWTTAHNILVGEGVLDDAVAVTDSYTLEFLNEIYGN